MAVGAGANRSSIGNSRRAHATGKRPSDAKFASTELPRTTRNRQSLESRPSRELALMGRLAAVVVTSVFSFTWA
jgi:hypothetical protein